MSIYLNEDETQRCNGYLEDIREGPQISKPTPSSGNPTIPYARTAKEFALAWARIVALSWPGSRSGGGGQRHGASHGNDAVRGLESHLCIEKYPTSTQEATLLRLGFVEHMEDDFEFFVQARRMLGEVEGSWLQQMLPWSFHQVKFAKVCLRLQHRLFPVGNSIRSTKHSTVSISIQRQHPGVNGRRNQLTRPQRYLGRVRTQGSSGCRDRYTHASVRRNTLRGYSESRNRPWLQDLP